jgi:hypothetical protein
MDDQVDSGATTELVAVPVQGAVSSGGVPVRGAAARWAVAIAIAAAMCVVSVAGIALVAGSGSASALASWAPADSSVYVEVRTDLPGDQQRNVGSLLARFPGLSDQASLDQKTNEAISGAVRSATDGAVDYGRDLKPWLGGEIAAAVGSLDTVSIGGSGDSVAGGSIVILATAKDPAAATAFLAARLPGTSASIEYAGATLTVSKVGDREIAWAVTGTTALLGDVIAAKKSLDAKASGGLAATDGFRSAVAEVPGDRVAFAWADARVVVAAAERLSAGKVDDAAAARMPDPASLPAWIAAAIRAEPAGATLDIVTPRPVAVDPGTPRTSAVSSRLPATTIASLEVHDVGVVLERTLKTAIADPALKDRLGQLAPLVDGSLGSFLDWAGDGAIVAIEQAGRTSPGFVALADDEVVARQRVAALRALVAFVDLPGGGRAQVTEQPYGDGTIVTVDLGDASTLLDALLQQAPTSSGAPGNGAFDPSMLESLVPSGRATIVYTVQRGIFVVGTDTAFVKAVVDTTPETSLASVPTYRSAIDMAGAKNDGQAFIDIAAAIDLARAMPGSGAADMGDIEPFLTPLDAVGVAYTATPDIIRLRFALTVAER